MTEDDLALSNFMSCLLLRRKCSRFFLDGADSQDDSCCLLLFLLPGYKRLVVMISEYGLQASSSSSSSTSSLLRLQLKGSNKDGSSLALNGDPGHVSLESRCVKGVLGTVSGVIGLCGRTALRGFTMGLGSGVASSIEEERTVFQIELEGIVAGVNKSLN